MSQNDLLKLLDLNARPPASAEVVSIVGPGSDPAGATNPTALFVDEWGLRRGRDLVAESERLRTAGTDEPRISSRQPSTPILSCWRAVSIRGVASTSHIC